MINAKQELLDDLKFDSKIICADISIEDYCEKNGKTEWQEKIIRLPLNYSQKDYEKFLSELDFEYDDGYGYQHLYGTVWLENNCWLERYEYDGSESWHFKETPIIPEYLRKNHWELV